MDTHSSDQTVEVHSGGGDKVLEFLSKNSANDDAAAASFWENIFYYKRTVFLTCHIETPSLAKLLRRVAVDIVGTAQFGELAKALEFCTALQELSIGVDETALLNEFAVNSQTDRSYTTELFRPQDVYHSYNLIILRVRGMDKLRQLTIPKVKFTALKVQDGDDPRRRNSGPIPGGILETVVAKDMMRPKEVTPVVPKSLKRKATSKPQKSDNQQVFRFLDLPAELRNSIYALVMQEPGAINPGREEIPTVAGLTTRTRIPTSGYLNGRKVPGRAPHSSLALLLINKQIHNEAVGIYYGANHFVFYYLPQFLLFLRSINRFSDHRASYIKTITLWVPPDYVQGEYSLMDLVLDFLGDLPKLETLTLQICREAARLLGASLKWTLPGEEGLKTLSKRGVDVKVRCQSADTVAWLGDKIEPVHVIEGAKQRIRGCELLEARVNGRVLDDRKTG